MTGAYTNSDVPRGLIRKRTCEAPGRGERRGSVPHYQTDGPPNTLKFDEERYGVVVVFKDTKNLHTEDLSEKHSG